MLSSNTSAVSGDANYIEDVFSTYLYTGNSSTQAINNGIDLSTKGGLVWMKNRSSSQNHYLFDTVRGTNSALFSDLNIEAQAYNFLNSFNTNGFTLNNNAPNTTGNNFASWTFRKQPKFFDVVTYTGTGSARTIAHSLGSTPGCIMVKRTDTTSGWNVYHRSLTSAAYELELNTTSAQFSDSTVWNSTAPTSTVFSVGTNGGVNASGGTYVAYIFAHDAGGFGLTGTDNVISCGSYTGAGTTPVNVELGFEPQWLLIKNAGGNEDWIQVDVMRGMSVGGIINRIRVNQSFGESGYSNVYVKPTATGFRIEDSNPVNWISESGKTFIYIAIRRGPMKNYDFLQSLTQV